MKFIKNLFVFLIVVVALLAGISQFLPATYRVERSILVQAGADKIHPLINDLSKWPEWSAWTTAMDPTLVYTYEGPAEGVGAVSKWDGKKTGDGMMTITESDPAKGIKFDMSMEHGKYQSKGWITFAPAGTDTKVIWGFAGDVSRNPIDRWFSVFMEKFVAPDFEKGLTQLKRKVEAK